ncbi:hypothetical protein CAC42_4756 [Sphaceloma murrayae]|uniref:Uncharacterized protein n=1 Tax=Sphaceloma murrayae TaxID=2082308 RepID=A0A2K1QP43_9PEZI|nr:hypothetical protein CAC42_4756 [Sphaceloma murrayae]
MFFAVDMAHLHVVDLDKRANATRERRQSRNVIKKVRTHSPASSTGTFFDDDQVTADSASSHTSCSDSTRVDSAMSSRSDERAKAADRAEQWRLERINEVKGSSSTSPVRQHQVSREPARQAMWPQALRIVKSPTWEDPRPAPHPRAPSAMSSHESSGTYATSQHNSSTDSIMSRPRPKMHNRLGSTLQDDSSSGSAASSRTNSQDHTGYQTSPDSAVNFENPWAPPPLTSPTMKMPGTVNSLAAMGSAPRDTRQIYRRSRTQPLPSPLHKPTGSTDWTAISPGQRRRPEPLAKMPTPPESPAQSVTDLYSPTSADIVIGRRVTVKGRDRSSSVPESAMSPKSPTFDNLAFPSPPSATESSRTTRIHVPAVGEPLTKAPEKQLPPHPFSKRRSLSADEAAKRVRLDASNPTPPASATYRVMHSANPSTTDFRSPTSPSLFRPDRITVLTDTLRELNTKSAAHFERYSKLRQGRQMLHSEILSVLQGTLARPRGGKTPVQLQLEIATMDAGIDDCVSKLSTLDKKRARLVEELVGLTAQGKGHERHESVGIREIVDTPRSPPVGGMQGLMEGMGRLAVVVDGEGDRYSGKMLPRIPRREVMSGASLSLANVMDFLDGGEEEEEEEEEDEEGKKGSS